MTKTTLELTNIFRSVITALEKLSDEEIGDLMADRKTISISLVDKPSKRAKIQESSKVDQKECVEKLNQMESREEGIKYLESFGLRRNELVGIANEAKAYVSGKEKVEEIIEKIVEATIGYRVRSQAIQGFDPSKQ